MKRLCLAVLLVACAACESDAPAPAAAVVDPDRPCAFASAGEIAGAVGGTAGTARSVEARSKDGTLLCTYGVGRPFNTVTLYVEDDVSRGEFVDRMARDPLNTDDLDGAGELAYTHGGVAVSVWEDGRAVSASLQHFGEPDATREALERLGQLIDSKL